MCTQKNLLFEPVIQTFVDFESIPEIKAQNWTSKMNGIKNSMVRCKNKREEHNS